MFLRANIRSALLSTVCCFLLLSPHVVRAQCSDSKVRQLAKDGETITDIADDCEMTKSAVKKVLSVREHRREVDDEDDEVVDKRLAPGVPLAPCACWGSADLQMQQPAPQCKSGYAHPQICHTPCPLGGFAWHGVCS